MIESFQIINFRLFEHLEVERLKRVNLIVGKNNTGKSTFLEAIELYVSNAETKVLFDLVESRQETWISEAQIQTQNTAENSIRHLFFGHKLPQVGEQGIVLRESSQNTELHIYSAAYQVKSDDDGIFRRVRVADWQLNIFDDEGVSNLEIHLVVTEGGKIRRIFRLDRDLRDSNYSYRSLYRRQEPALKSLWQVVSTENIPSRKLAALWDLTSLTTLEGEVISALKLIDERVSGVAFVEDISQEKRADENRIPLVKLDGVDEPLPLKSMGDGMTRLFHIVVALVNAKNGFLLVDEFENGLHWSVQPKVWDIIFKLSEKLNVQVFATTHSRDCIEGFDQIWNKYPNLGAFFRLDVKDELIKATEYPSETLTDAIEMDVEVR